MTDAAKQEKAIRAMVAINAAIRNIHLYPISSASVIVTVDKAYHLVLETLEADGDAQLVFAESEKHLLICDVPLSDAEQKKPQISAFLGLLLNLGIRNITIRKGLARDEFCSFLEAISTAVRKGGKKKASPGLSDRTFPHIFLNHKVYVSLDQDRDVTSGGGEGAVDVQKDFSPMVSTLDYILVPETKEEVARYMAASLVSGDEQVLSDILIQKMDGELGAKLFDHLIREMDDDVFERLVLRIRQRHDAAASENGAVKEDGADDRIRALLRDIMRTERGVQLQARLKEKKAREEAERKKRALRLMAGIGSILNDQPDAFRDKVLMKFLPDAVCSLLINRQEKQAERLIDRLGDGLLSKDNAVRGNVSCALSRIIGKIGPAHRIIWVRRLSYNLTDWIRIETAVTPAYEKICIYLTDLAKEMICSGKSAEANHILDAFDAIGSEEKQGDATCRRLACDMFREVASGDVMSQLLTEFQASDQERRRQGMRSLTRLGAAAVPALLDILRKSEDRYERARVLRVIAGIGRPGLEDLESRIETDAPWYYIRNLILLFGRIGNISHVDLIRPFLIHGDQRVRRECLNSIYLIGGGQRESVFLSALPSVDDRLKLDIVRLLGRMRSSDAVPMLLHLIDPEKFMPSKMNNQLAEQVCIALGHIGEKAALPALRAIASRKRDLLGQVPGGNALRSAAAKAILEINSGPDK